MTSRKKELADIDFSHWIENNVDSDSETERKRRYLDSHSSSRLSFIEYLDGRPGVQFIFFLFNQTRASFEKPFDRAFAVQRVSNVLSSHSD